VNYHIIIEVNIAVDMWILECDGGIFQGKHSKVCVGCYRSLTVFTKANDYGYGRAKSFYLGELGEKMVCLAETPASTRSDLRMISGTEGFVIDHKSISRKHLTIEIGAVDDGDGVSHTMNEP
jgi:hypothetical protein